MLSEVNMTGKAKYHGISLSKRIKEVNDIYDANIHSGLSNREIWRRHIWPVYGISEATFYGYLKKYYQLPFVDAGKG